MFYYILADEKQKTSDILGLTDFDLYRDFRDCQKIARKDQRIYMIEFEDSHHIAQALSLLPDPQATDLEITVTRAKQLDHDYVFSVVLEEKRSSSNFQVIAKMDKNTNPYPLTDNETDLLHSSANGQPNDYKTLALPSKKEVDLEALYDEQFYGIPMQRQSPTTEDIKSEKILMQWKNIKAAFRTHLPWKFDPKWLIEHAYNLNEALEYPTSGIHLWADKTLEAKIFCYKKIRNLLLSIEDEKGWFSINNDAKDLIALEILSRLEAHLRLILDTLGLKEITQNKMEIVEDKQKNAGVIHKFVVKQIQVEHPQLAHEHTLLIHVGNDASEYVSSRQAKLHDPEERKRAINEVFAGLKQKIALNDKLSVDNTPPVTNSVYNEKTKKREIITEYQPEKASTQNSILKEISLLSDQDIKEQIAKMIDIAWFQLNKLDALIDDLVREKIMEQFKTKAEKFLTEFFSFGNEWPRLTHSNANKEEKVDPVAEIAEKAKKCLLDIAIVEIPVPDKIIQDKIAKKMQQINGQIHTLQLMIAEMKEQNSDPQHLFNQAKEKLKECSLSANNVKQIIYYELNKDVPFTAKLPTRSHHPV